VRCSINGRGGGGNTIFVIPTSSAVKFPPSKYVRPVSDLNVTSDMYVQSLNGLPQIMEQCISDSVVAC
jgi:hypothetical protein